jgi:hypothetical protein
LRRAFYLSHIFAATLRNAADSVRSAACFTGSLILECSITFDLGIAGKLQVAPQSKAA